MRMCFAILQIIFLRNMKIIFVEHRLYHIIQKLYDKDLSRLLIYINMPEEVLISVSVLTVSNHYRIVKF